MDGVNKTLYIPLYGKAYVSRKGLFLTDKKAEEVWQAEGFPLKGKSGSKWLAYYMGIRAVVFDQWTKERIETERDAVVIHLGCGLDSRALRVGVEKCKWYDVDFPEVIRERKRYYTESDSYRMLEGDAGDGNWLQKIPETKAAIVVMEGVSMYLCPEAMCALVENLSCHFERISFLMDCYTVVAAKMSKYKNPIHDVGVTEVYGIDDPMLLQRKGLLFVKEHGMTPEVYIRQLQGLEKKVFKKLYAGRFSKKLYRMFEYKKV